MSCAKAGADLKKVAFGSERLTDRHQLGNYPSVLWLALTSSKRIVIRIVLTRPNSSLVTLIAQQDLNPLRTFEWAGIETVGATVGS
jgi:hypothetical protein